MSDNYQRNDPKGWGGDPSRGAALGRPTIKDADKAALIILLYSRVALDDGGYDVNGTYFGQAGPLYWFRTLDDAHGAVDYMKRTSDPAWTAEHDYPNCAPRDADPGDVLYYRQCEAFMERDDEFARDEEARRAADSEDEDDDEDTDEDEDDDSLTDEDIAHLTEALAARLADEADEGGPEDVMTSIGYVGLWCDGEVTYDGVVIHTIDMS